MDFDNSIKLSKNIDTTIHMNKQVVYKTIGSLNIYKDEQDCETCFKCMDCIGSHDYNDWLVFSGRKNNLGLSQTPDWNSFESTDVCIRIDCSSFCSNRRYYNDIVKHIFINNGIFYAKEVCNLAEYIVKYPFNLTRANSLLSTIYLQYQMLLESGHSISYIDLEDILVIINDVGEEPLFFFSNYEKIYKVDAIKNPHDYIRDSNDYIRVIHFYDHDNFVLPPELVENTTIPFICHKSDWLYSLACVVLCCFNPGKIEDMWNGTCSSDVGSSDVGSSVHDKHEYIMKLLSEYTGTKMYYTLLYCLSKEPCNREFILF
jgi:hypothetical protein